jgi:hypothetical protein
MQNGDISNQVAPRIVLVFENLLGSIPKEKTRKHYWAMKRHAWTAAANCWDLDKWTLAKMWDLTYRHKASIDVVTYLREEEAEKIYTRLDARGYPIANWWVTDLDGCLHDIITNPSVMAIVDATPGRAWTYGRKGASLEML